MGLRKVFDAEEAFAFREWGGEAGAYYNARLITPPRHFVEDLSSPYSPGALWVTKRQSEWDDTVINCFSPALDCIFWPSWSSAWWQHDARFGRFVWRATQTDIWSGLVTDAIAPEPGGELWMHGSYASAWYGGAVHASTRNGAIALSGTVLPSAEFGKSSASLLSNFAIDRANDRVFIRWGGEANNAVKVYALSDPPPRVPRATLWAPTSVVAVVLTGDGTVYLFDSLGWIVAYGYDGPYGGAMRQPLAAVPPHGRAFGWDPYRKRILWLDGTASAADGASTLKVQGYYPVPDPALLTPPIPCKSPRKGRAVPFVSHVAGVGGEALAGRAGIINGVSATTDRDGDLIAILTPETAGDLTAEVTIS